MKFGEVVGQAGTAARLLRQAHKGRVAHAQLFCGVEGCGKFPLALAYAGYLLCDSPTPDGGCGTCPACVKTRALAHPDLHFIFPTVKSQTCRSLYPRWRAMLARSPYFSLDTWLAEMEAGNQQPVIYAQESDTIRQNLMLHSSEGGRKVVVVWLPERMNETAANKMLKLLEEPPSDTVFLMVSDAPETLLPTVTSRTQRVDIPPVAENDMRDALARQHGLTGEDAVRVARLARGSYTEALRELQAGDDGRIFLDSFMTLMRNAYARDLRGLLEWSERIAAWGRERQKNFLGYTLRLVRENFMYNFRMPQLNYMGEAETGFSARFSKFINERNVIALAHEIERASAGISRNANAAVTLFDLAMRVIILIRK